MHDLKKYINNISPLSEVTWQQFQNIFKERRLSNLDFFVREGEIATKIGILQEGLVRGFYRNEDGIEYNKTFFTAPSFIGAYASLITKKENLINQQALSDCNIYEAKYHDFEQLCSKNIELERLAKKIAQLHFVQKEKREIELVMLDAEKRYDILKSEFPNIENQVQQYHIASYLGITPTQLSRIRKKIKSLHM
ncbi:Crp/Fnr family transcriptional regulator [Rhizosphaericola mali]|uniref:Crp/Fnr family transcriptional regulator n=1 Tax=Rhizosphaericola mali TaxID=2545455 RepID=A0A5P2G9I3_9BACT|nr:Crp/Fnr family transcriptional regulator [Rhizosphaericola mali]QES90602.1 Crp/Fnr family transcriptional regulator [Rhizosphaericola mali]